MHRQTHASLDLAIPILAALDIAETLAWYADRLGFEIRHDFGDYGIVRRDRILLNFWLCKDRHIAENTSAYLNVTGADALHAEWRARHPDTRMTQPKDFDYGMREFHVWDLNGNLLRLGEPIG